MEGRSRSTTMGPGFLTGFSLTDEKEEPDKCPDDPIQGRRNNPGNAMLAQIAKDVTAGYMGVLHLTKARSMFEAIRANASLAEQSKEEGQTKEAQFPFSQSTRPTEGMADDSSQVTEIEDFTVIGDTTETGNEEYEQNPTGQGSTRIT